MVSRSPHPQVGIERWSLSLLIFIGTVLLLDTLNNGWSRKNWENSLILICLVFSLLEIAVASFWYVQASTVTGQGFFSLPFGYRSSGLFIGHANVLSGFLNLVIPLLVIRILSKPGFRVRLGYFSLLCIFFITQFLTSSRGGWLSGAVGIAVATSYFVIRHESVRTQISELLRSHYSRIRLIFITLLSTLVLLLGLGLLIRQAQTTPGHAPLTSSRSGIWNPALTIIEDSPIIGHGLASFSTLYSEQNLSPPGFTTSHAHNLFLQTIVQSGFVGFMLVLAMIYLLAKDLIPAAWIIPKKNVANYAPYLGAIAAFSIHHFVDYLIESPGYVISLALILTLAIYQTHSTYIQVPLRKARVLFGASFLIVILLNVRTISADLSYWRGVEAFRENRLDEASNLICKAADSDPFSFYQFQCGLSHAFLSDVHQDKEHLELAREYYNRGLQLDAGWPIYTANYAALLNESGNSTEAVQLLELTLERAPRHFSMWMNLGLWFDELGNAADSHEAVSQALKSNPMIYRSEIFSRDQTWAATLDNFMTSNVDDLEGHPEFTAWQALDSSNYDEAETQFKAIINSNPLSTSGYKGLSETKLNTGNFSAAQTSIRIALFLDPSDPYSHFLLGRIYEASGEDNRAMKSYIAGYEALKNQSDSWSYYARTYHRFFPEPDFIPQLLRYFPSTQEVKILCTLAVHYYETDQSEMAMEIENLLIRLGTESSCGVK
jgi:tetratricopeptide (TPR) repeat protein